jgi:hypothetical protein
MDLDVDPLVPGELERLLMAMAGEERRRLLGRDRAEPRLEELLLGAGGVGDEQVEIAERSQVSVGVELGDRDPLEHDRVLVEDCGDARQQRLGEGERTHRAEFRGKQLMRDRATLSAPRADGEQFQAMTEERLQRARALDDAVDSRKQRVERGTGSRFRRRRRHHRVSIGEVARSAVQPLG